MSKALHYTEETFATTYDLAPEDARRMIAAVGTAKADLDVFIMAYRNRAAMADVMLNPGNPVDRRRVRR
jgi:hypothetical protein